MTRYKPATNPRREPLQGRRLTAEHAKHADEPTDAADDTGPRIRTGGNRVNRGWTGVFLLSPFPLLSREPVPVRHAEKTDRIRPHGINEDLGKMGVVFSNRPVRSLVNLTGRGVIQIRIQIAKSGMPALGPLFPALEVMAGGRRDRIAAN